MRAFFLALLGVVVFGFQAAAAPVIGKAAPDFTAQDIAGATVKLSALKGKIVVLEWNNPGCPFVKKFYGAGAMQSLQNELKENGTVWITVNSGAEGKQGYMGNEEAKTYVSSVGGAANHYILDPEGKIGRLYGAKTTPHMFVVDSKGNLAYMGAIDDKATADSADIAAAKNYVRAAVSALREGKPVEQASTQAYGCGVKYKD